jgi:hypothetical protein
VFNRNDSLLSAPDRAAFRRPNVFQAKLRGQLPREYANSGMMVAAYTAGERRVICNQHDAATLVFGPGASAPDRSRAASASAWS